jgi:hypothetical protein
MDQCPSEEHYSQTGEDVDEDSFQKSDTAKKLFDFYGTTKFIAMFTTAHNLTLSRARFIQSTSPHAFFFPF